jgi:XRE family aerobic/anaerobic benzoate catabolism transcriptional regulator
MERDLETGEAGSAAGGAGHPEQGDAGVPANGRAVFLAVARQVRLQRSRRGMTRRELSRRAAISERYLGEVEKGRANVTLGMLMRIADTLGEPLSTFLPTDEGSARISRPLVKLLSRLSAGQQAALYRRLLRETKAERDGVRGVALIGLRGAGKSTLGAMLAQASGVPFVRLTDTIQDLSGMATGELLEMMGPDAYRRLERQALERIVAAHRLAVLEAGGGLVLETDTFNLLMQTYRVVWLKAAPEEHMQRVTAQGDLRPMAGNTQAMDELRAILKEREPYYSQADHVIDTAGRTVDEVFSELDAVCRATLRRR